MKYRISKTAIIGFSYYFAYLFMLMPYKFNKLNPGSPFQVAQLHVVLAVITWISITACFLSKGYYIVTLWNIACAYFFTSLYSRNKIIICLNSTYTLLKNTKHRQKIIFPALIIFSSFLVRTVFCVPIISTHYKPDMYTLSVEFMYCLNYSLETTINSLCFATALVFKDIRLQISSLGERRFVKQSYLHLVYTQWKACQQVDLISQAFSPFLFHYITFDMCALMYVYIYFRPIVKHFSLSFPLLMATWSLTVMCYCSQLINTEAEQLFMEIQRLTYKNKQPEARRVLMVMMEQIRLCKLHISIQGCFKLHLPLLLTLANVFVTYMVVLLGILN